MSRRPTILVALGCFAVSQRVSGPNSSLIEAVKALSDQFDFRIVGLADEGEVVGRWHDFEGCQRIAIRRSPAMGARLWEIVRDTPHDLMVCNGFFDHTLTLPALVLHRAGAMRSPLLLATRGEFSPAALALGRGRKGLYLAALKALGLLRNVRFQATDQKEAGFIANGLPGADILVGPNIRRAIPVPEFQVRGPNEPLRLVFASRIDRMKNLDWGLRMLRDSVVPLRLDIYGPISKADHWQECETIIASMPSHVEVGYLGPLSPDEMIPTIGRYDLYLSPTRGENFGHGIADALLAATPALIADTTPWRGLREVRAGADLPLDDPEAWRDFLSMFSALSEAQVRTWRSGARAFVEQRLDEKVNIALLADCYRTAMAGRRSNARQDRGDKRVSGEHVRN